MWDSILEVFPKHKVLLIDLPGHGNSTAYDQQAYSMEFMAKKVQEVLEYETISNPILMGHSMGGYVGLELIKNVALEKLILLNSNFWADSDERRSNRNRVLEIVKQNKSVFLLEAIRNLFHLKSEQLDLVINDLIQKAARMESDEIIKTTKGLRDRNQNQSIVIEKADNMIVIQAENDPIIPVKEMEQEVNKLHKKPEYHEIENSGHMSIWENPKATIRILSKILND